MTDKMSELVIVLGAMILLIVAVVSFAVVIFLPTWYAITNDWENYIVWIPIVYTISRMILGPTAIVISAIFLIWKRNINSIMTIIYQVIMVWFGYPTLQNLWITLVTTPLGGVELQRNIIQVLAFTTFGIFVTYASVSHNHKEYVKK